ncbi:DUF1510 family protein [Ornithinibacillus sp. 4-3]|uniref:DUF1510 family protein n=1 Tax=Ornithinibacillus sp. 4-3 TaxID=3231488 RepID=A0AB39HN10_9BACI
MDSQEIRGSRTDKMYKRRKNARAIYILLFIFIALLAVWVWMLATSDKDDAQENDENEIAALEDDESEANADAEDNEEEANQDNEADADDENEPGAEDEDNQEEPQDETNDDGRNLIENDPDDENVVETYAEEWDPLPTEQEEPHSINFDKESQDRNEIEEAITFVTDLNGDDMVVWWLENAGDQQIRATVSDSQETVINRVHLRWVDAEGWQPIKVEVLKENDQKWRFR